MASERIGQFGFAGPLTGSSEKKWSLSRTAVYEADPMSMAVIAAFVAVFSVIVFVSKYLMVCHQWSSN
ncbi:MAG: hypothetical protein WA667_08255 [Candidatus Nitrosopolaris sp.]